MAEYLPIIVVAMAVFVIAMIVMCVWLEKEQKKRDKHITKAQIIAVNGKPCNQGQVVIRGIVGGMLGGTPGVLLGALSTPNQTENEYTFLVFYDDGSRNTEKVTENSQRFDFLITKIK